MNKSLILSALLLSQASMAGTLVKLVAVSGHVKATDQFTKECELSDTGMAHYVYTKAGKVVDETRVELSEAARKQIVEDIEQARGETKYAVQYPTGGGDIADFSLVGYPDDTTKMMIMHASGMDMTKYSPAAKQIFDAMTQACSLKMDIVEMKVRNLFHKN